MKRKIRFIVNPKSGIQSKKNIPSLINLHLDKSKFDFEIVETQHRYHAFEISQASIEEGFDIVCAVGGDGSVHEVGTALIGTKVQLAVIPAGSGNGLARHLKIPMNAKEAIIALNESVGDIMDTVRVNDRHFLNVGGYGFDALIAKEFDSDQRRGFWGYVKLILKEFFGYKSSNFDIEINGEIRKEKLVLCTIANASEYGNSFFISPDSNIADGTIELCMLHPFKLWNVPALVYVFFKKTHKTSRFITIIPFKKGKITLEKAVAHYDGEPFEVQNELNIEVVPKSLHILVGK
jgi:YegS/Rv2252/BmrU family lipid kinase